MSRFSFPVLALALLVAAAFAAAPFDARDLAAQEQGPTERPFTIVAKKFSFTPSRIEVYEGDLVRIELSAEDIAHSFTIDGYRISKRASPRHPVTFDFRADRVGTFPIYCNLQLDEGCRRMKGELVVKPRR